jgi:5-formyltetrahydrofolate cyclo-ligase
MRESSKETVRETLLRRRRGLSADQRRSASRAICRHLLRWPPFLERERVAGYVAVDGEVDPREALEARLSRGGDVWLPRVTETEPPEMEFAPISGFDDLEEGAYDIPEPRGLAGDLAAIDLLLIPGAGFDRDGRRLGMGMGYYDRVLAERLARSEGAPGTERRRDDVLLVGLCYDCQLQDEPLPTDSHDVDMDYVITEHDSIRTRETTHDGFSK